MAAAVAAANAWKATGGVASAFASVPSRPIEEIPDSTIKELMMTGLNAAKSAGAGYCRRAHRTLPAELRRHARAADRATSSTPTRSACGVRALVDGTWGFAATRDADEGRRRRRGARSGRRSRRRIASRATGPSCSRRRRRIRTRRGRARSRSIRSRFRSSRRPSCCSRRTPRR